MQKLALTLIPVCVSTFGHNRINVVFVFCCLEWENWERPRNMRGFRRAPTICDPHHHHYPSVWIIVPVYVSATFYKNEEFGWMRTLLNSSVLLTPTATQVHFSYLDIPLFFHRGWTGLWSKNWSAGFEERTCLVAFHCTF